MRAARLSKYGLDGIEIVEAEAPTPGPGQVTIATAASSLNPVDLETVLGGNKILMAVRPPFVPGVDLAGTVRAVGTGVTDFEVGERVVAYTGVPTPGAFAEVGCVPADTVARVPDGVSLPDAAALCLAGLAAWEAVEALSLKSGQRVLVHGAAGAVGQAAMQIALSRGIDVVANVHSRDAEHARARGASKVLCYDREAFESDGLEVDGVVDTVGGATFKRSLKVTKSGGVVASLKAVPGPGALRAAGFSVPWLLRPILGLLAAPKSKRGVTIAPIITKPSRRGLEQVMQLAAEGKLVANVVHTAPLADLRTLLTQIDEGALRGKAVVTV